MDIRRSGESHNENAGSDMNAQNNSNGGGQSASQPRQGGGSGSPILWVVILLVLVGLGVYFFGGQLGVMDSDATGSNGSGPIARVGGEAVERSGFDQQLTALREATTTQAQQFQSLSETRQQELVLSRIINQELLRQAAVNAGVSVSDSDVDSQLQSQIEQIGGESEFQSRLDANDLTREEVRENLRQQLLINQYVSQASGTTTDQQIQQLYNQYRSQLSQASGTSTQNIPSLEQLRPQLQATIQQQNQQQLLQQARENITVEVLLEGVSYPPSSTQQQPAGTTNGTQPAAGTSSSGN